MGVIHHNYLQRLDYSYGLCIQDWVHSFRYMLSASHLSKIRPVKPMLFKTPVIITTGAEAPLEARGTRGTRESPVTSTYATTAKSLGTSRLIDAVLMKTM